MDSIQYENQNITDINVTVAVRIKPSKEQDEQCEIWHGPVRNYITVRSTDTCCSFDYVAPPNCNQSQFFSSTLNPLVTYLLEGYNVSVIGYGEKDSGKSYTLLGPCLHIATSATEQGLAPRAVREIFTRLDFEPDKYCKVFITGIEIKDDNIIYLTNPLNQLPKENLNHRLSEHSVYCKNVKEALSCLVDIMNTANNNSHLILKIALLQYNRNGSNLYSELHIVDLISSEYSAIDINLYSFENLISVLSNLKYPTNELSHFTYSNLTQLLKPSFGGETITLFICCIIEDTTNVVECLKTLHVGKKVQEIINRPTINVQEFSITPDSMEHVQVIHPSDSPAINNESPMDIRENFMSDQWKKLLVDASELFHKISECKTLNQQDIQNIRQWLCLKQECEEVEVNCNESVVRDRDHHIHRSLDVIGEISETEEERQSNSELNEEEEQIEENSLLDCIDIPENTSCPPHIELTPQTASDVEKQCETPERNIILRELMDKFSQFSISLIDDQHRVDTNTLTQQFGTLDVIEELHMNKTDVTAEVTLAQQISQNDALIDVQMKKSVLDVQLITNKVNSLEATIKTKESSLQYLLKNSQVRLAANDKLKRKLRKLEEHQEAARTRIEHLQKFSKIEPSGRAEVEMDKLKSAIKFYRQKANDIAAVIQLNDEFAKKMRIIEDSLDSNYHTVEKLKKQLRKEIRHKSSIEKLLKEQNTKLEEQLAIENLKRSKTYSKQTIETVVTIEDTEDNNQLRKSINKIRQTKDKLINERSDLVNKLKTKNGSDCDKKILLQIEEAIEAMDLIIEFRNEALCGRKSVLHQQCHQDDLVNRILLSNLSKLTAEETKILLYKYFNRTIELMDSGKKQDELLKESGMECEIHKWRFKGVVQALQENKFATERQLLNVQHNHEKEIHLLLNVFAEETENISSNAIAIADKRRGGFNFDTSVVRPDNRIRRLHTSGGAAAAAATIASVHHHEATGHSTKITRERNKLVIQRPKVRKYQE